MIYTNLTNAELVRHVDNSNAATPLERELAQRLSEVTDEVKMVEAVRDQHAEDLRVLRNVVASARAVGSRL